MEGLPMMLLMMMMQRTVCMIITWMSLSDGLGGEEDPLCGSLGEGAACVCGRHPGARRQS